MYRLVKLNLYNYKLYKKMMDEIVLPFKNNFYKFFLFPEDKDDHEKITKYFVNEERTKRNNKIMKVTYFLFDTNENSFVGASHTEYDEDLQANVVFFFMIPKFSSTYYYYKLVCLYMEIAKEKGEEITYFASEMDDNDLGGAVFGCSNNHCEIMNYYGKKYKVYKKTF